MLTNPQLGQKVKTRDNFGSYSNIVGVIESIWGDQTNPYSVASILLDRSPFTDSGHRQYNFYLHDLIAISQTPEEEAQEKDRLQREKYAEKYL